MSDILSRLDGAICHMDDILVHEKAKAEYDSQVCAVLARVQRGGLVLNQSKCCFNQATVKLLCDFLCHVIDVDGLHPDPKKASAIIN